MQLHSIADMTLAFLAHQAHPVVGDDVGVSVVSESVQEFASSLLARIGTDAAMLGKAPKLLADTKKIREQFRTLANSVLALEDIKEQRNIAKTVSTWLPQITDSLNRLDQFDVSYQVASREIRRAQSRPVAMMAQIGAGVLELHNMMVDLLELIDPAPVGYLETETRKIHGDRSESLLSSFNELATSDGFSQEAFKQRHSLK